MVSKPKNEMVITEKAIEVNSVEEEYEFINTCLSEAGATLKVVNRHATYENNPHSIVIDHFNLMCIESGKFYSMSFMIDMNSEKYRNEMR